MKSKWLALLLLGSSSLFVVGCSARYSTRYQQPRFRPGYSRYDSRTWETDHRRHHRREYRRQN